MWRSFALKASLLVLMLSLCVGVPIVTAEGVPWPDFYSVDMLDANDGWAVGYYGTIIRWNGSDWSTVVLKTLEVLRSVDMLNASDGWIVGHAGTILRWTGTDWIIPEFPTVILMPLLVSITLVTAILAKMVSKKHRKPSLPSKTQP